MTEVLRVSPTASLIRIGTSWLLEDPLRGGNRQLNDFPGWLGHVLVRLMARGAMPIERVRAEISAGGVPEKQVERCLASLRSTGLLVPELAVVPPRDSGALRDHQLANIFSESLDYSQPDIMKYDRQLMESYAKDGAPPAPFLEMPADWPRRRLPHPVLDSDQHPLHAIGRVLYMINGILSDVTYGPLARTKRTPPSHGASHPFDIAVATTLLTGACARTYYYDPDDHSLAEAPASSPGDATVDSGSGATRLSIHLTVQRVQWRYRSSLAYPTIFLDLGHVVETLHLVAGDLGLTVEDRSIAGASPLAPSLPWLGPTLSVHDIRFPRV
jgi:hypothetical protein